MSIDPRALRTFLAVCRENSISGAARWLNISQPSVSVTISNLEATLNAKLFDRARSGIALSPAGIALRRRAEALEQLLEVAVEEVALVQQAIDGPIRIGGTPGALASLVPAIVKHLSQGDRAFEMRVVERPDGELTDTLRRGEIDIAVVTTGIETPPDDIVEHAIARDPFSLIVGASHAQLPDRIALKDAIAMRWVMPDAAGAFRRQINALFIAAAAPLPREVIRCDSLLTTKAIVRQTDFVALLPRGVADAELAAGSLRAITLIGEQIDRSIGFRTMRDAPATPLLSKLLASFQEADCIS